MKFNEVNQLVPLLYKDLWYKLEKEFLYGAAYNAPPGALVEIGTSCGYSSVFLAAAAHEKGAKFYTIDPYGLPGERENHDIGNDLRINEFHKNMEKLNIPNNWELIQNYSYEAAKQFHEPVAFVFIDGCHCYKCVKRDYELWASKLMINGILVFHDAGFDGPAKVIKLVENSNTFGDKKVGSNHPISGYTAYFIKINKESNK